MRFQEQSVHYTIVGNHVCSWIDKKADPAGRYSSSLACPDWFTLDLFGPPTGAYASFTDDPMGLLHAGALEPASVHNYADVVDPA